MIKSFILLVAMCLSSLVLASPVWIDVRTAEEYAQDHIGGDIRISHESIVPKIQQLFPDKDTEIHLYCRSGRRAGIALSKLKAAGYKNVLNAGGISDARKERGLSKENCTASC